MFFAYRIILIIGLIVLLPRFIFDAIVKGKYAAGFKQRLGFLPKFDSHGKKVIWLHCVSVGEANAARPLAQRIKHDHPDSSLIVSTTTKPGQHLAQTIFADIADLVFYFPFDFRSTVRRTLRHLGPSVVLLMETEIWFNFIREADRNNVQVAIVNGRLSPRSFKRFSYIKNFMKRVLGHLDLALMQEKADATRLMSLGMRANVVRVTGNIKFDHDLDDRETALTAQFQERFGLRSETPLIIAASTHAPEEAWILAAFKQEWKTPGEDLPRLLIAPRHPERFGEVADLIENTGFSWVRRSAPESPEDKTAEIILLDSIGELRAAYPLAELVFVGGSLIPHGGQSIYEPAAAGRAILTGPHTVNFDAAVKEFLEKEGLIQLPAMKEDEVVTKLAEAFSELLHDNQKRRSLGTNAFAVMNNNRGAVEKTITYLAPILKPLDH